MRDLVSFGMCVLALMVVPAMGCSSSDNGETGGSAGSGGSAGAGGSGGSAGTGGGGTGGAASPQSGVWMGQGTGGAGGTFNACLVVNEAGTAISANGIDCQSFAIQVGIADCGSLWTKVELQIEDGSFEVIDGTNTITGMFDSATIASGTFTNSAMDCSGAWTATLVSQ